METLTNDVAATGGYITRQDIVNFPFPYKLWIVVHLENCDFLQWNRDGTVILLDLAALDDYLNSARSIFKIKNRSTFLKHLEEFNFERLNANPEAEEDILLQYQNENFQRHRLDLLAKIRRHTYELIGNISDSTTKNKEEQKSSTDHMFSSFPALAQETAMNGLAAERMVGDLCFMFHGGLSNIQRSRLRFQTSLHFQNESRILLEKLRVCDENAARLRRAKLDQGSGGRSTMSHDDDQLIEIPVELFENPHDSVLNLGEDFHPEYAGYYGNCSKETITNFFGDYLPMYEDGTMEIRKIIADNSSSNNEIIAEANINNDTPTCSLNINPGINIETVTTSTPNQSLTNFNFSSGLEPIFNYEDNQELVQNTNSVFDANDNVIQLTNPNNFDIEAEIAMEEFIKFKDPLALSNTDLLPDGGEKEKDDIVNEVAAVAAVAATENVNESVNNYGSVEAERFPQMPAAVKMVIEEDPIENEANFRNFFSQYKASLNLLYDHH